MYSIILNKEYKTTRTRQKKDTFPISDHGVNVLNSWNCIDYSQNLLTTLS